MARGKQIVRRVSKNSEECLELFIRHCQTKNLSPRTVQTYRFECKKFVDWYGADKEANQITQEIVESYISFIQKQDISEIYVATKIRQIRAFLYYCMEREYIEKFIVRVPKTDVAIKEPYTQKELEKLLRKPQSNNWIEWRCWAMANYFLSTGNRLSTALNLKIEDIDFANDLIKLRVTKNRKQQYIPMSSTLKDVLRLYLSMWEHNENDYLFPEYEGKKLSERGAQGSIRNYNLKRGVTKSSVHLFRHTYAKYYIMSGGEATYLQRLLGHSTLTMTNHYINLYATDLQRDYDKYNPLDNVLKGMYGRS